MTVKAKFLRTAILKNICERLLLRVFPFRSRHRRCSVRKVFLEILQNSSGKHLCESLFLIKLQAACNFIKKESLVWCFLAIFAKFLRTPLQNTSWRQLLKKTFSSKTKQKGHSKTQLGKTNLPFHDGFYHFIFLCFSTAHLAAFALYNKR